MAGHGQKWLEQTGIDWNSLEQGETEWPSLGKVIRSPVQRERLPHAEVSVPCRYHAGMARYGMEWDAWPGMQAPCRVPISFGIGTLASRLNFCQPLSWPNANPLAGLVPAPQLDMCQPLIWTCASLSTGLAPASLLIFCQPLRWSCASPSTELVPASRLDFRQHLRWTCASLQAGLKPASGLDLCQPLSWPYAGLSAGLVPASRVASCQPLSYTCSSPLSRALTKTIF